MGPGPGPQHGVCVLCEYVCAFMYIYFLLYIYIYIFIYVHLHLYFDSKRFEIRLEPPNPLRDYDFVILSLQIMNPITIQEPDYCTRARLLYENKNIIQEYNDYTII